MGNGLAFVGVVNLAIAQHDDGSPCASVGAAFDLGHHDVDADVVERFVECLSAWVFMSNSDVVGRE